MASLPDHQPSEGEPLSPSPTDPLMANNDQRLIDESSPGDSVAFYTALVRT